MCLSFQAEYFPSHEDVLGLVVLTEEHFAQEKKLRELGWCADYMMDKRENNDFMTDFVFINYSLNRRIIDDQHSNLLMILNFAIVTFVSLFLNS